MGALLRVSNLRTYYFSFGGARVVKGLHGATDLLRSHQTHGAVAEIAGRNLKTGLVWGYNQAVEDSALTFDPYSFAYERNWLISAS